MKTTIIDGNLTFEIEALPPANVRIEYRVGALMRALTIQAATAAKLGRAISDAASLAAPALAAAPKPKGGLKP